MTHSPKGNEQKYNFISNNCVQVVVNALRNSDKRFEYFSRNIVLIPNLVVREASILSLIDNKK